MIPKNKSAAGASPCPAAGFHFYRSTLKKSKKSQKNPEK